MQSFNYAGNHLCHREMGARKQKLPEEIRNKREKIGKVTGSWEKSAGSLPHPRKTASGFL